VFDIVALQPERSPGSVYTTERNMDMGMLRIVVRYGRPTRRASQVTGDLSHQLACQLLEIRPLAELRRHDQFPHPFITRPLPSVENGRHVECVTLITECTHPNLLRPRCAVAGNVPAMSPPLPFDGISREGNANRASLMERLPIRRRTLDSPRYPASTHPRLV
jgi:hypothetical protein